MSPCQQRLMTNDAAAACVCCTGSQTTHLETGLTLNVCHISVKNESIDDHLGWSSLVFFVSMDIYEVLWTFIDERVKM